MPSDYLSYFQPDLGVLRAFSTGTASVKGGANGLADIHSRALTGHCESKSSNNTSLTSHGLFSPEFFPQDSPSLAMLSSPSRPTPLSRHPYNRPVIASQPVSRFAPYVETREHDVSRAGSTSKATGEYKSSRRHIRRQRQSRSHAHKQWFRCQQPHHCPPSPRFILSRLLVYHSMVYRAKHISPSTWRSPLTSPPLETIALRA